MNLFRSEEHARNWEGFDPAMASSLQPVAEWARHLLQPVLPRARTTDYISWTRSDAGRAGFVELRDRLAPTAADRRLDHSDPARLADGSHGRRPERDRDPDGIQLELFHLKADPSTLVTG